jgi:hypothetical protein
MSQRWPLVVAATVLSLAVLFRTAMAEPETAGIELLRDPRDFAPIADPSARSVALFGEMGKVIQSPRCLNCHPVGNRPTQTEAMRPHQPLVVRGTDGIGAPGMHCANCHHAENFDPAHVPGNPKWSLAPAEMAWQHKTLGQICRQIQDPARNGGRSLAQIVHHMGNDELVGWAWHPGAGRRPAPGTQMQLGALAQAWVDTGAHCPA